MHGNLDLLPKAHGALEMESVARLVAIRFALEYGRPLAQEGIPIHPLGLIDVIFSVGLVQVLRPLVPIYQIMSSPSVASQPSRKLVKLSVQPM